MAAVFRIAKMSLKMLAAVVGCVKINHTMSATKRNPTILQNFTANYPSASVVGTRDAYLYRIDRIGGIPSARRFTPVPHPDGLGGRGARCGSRGAGVAQDPVQ